MHHYSSFFGSMINIIIIIAIVKLVYKYAKKNKQAEQGESKDRVESFPDKQMKNSNGPRINPPVRANMGRPTSPVRNLQYENKITDKDKLQLKRCSNCGGEIPLTMMKCTICGQRQAGCSWIAVVFIILVATLFAIAVSNDSGFTIMPYLHQIFKF